MTQLPETEIYEAVELILRDDLKLGDTKVERDTPLFDGELGLDSLDALMLVTGVEKRLNIKLPNKKLGKNSMSTIDHFVTFIRNETAVETS